VQAIRIGICLHWIVSFSSNAQASGHVYLLRRLAGIFSTGLDVLDEKLIQRGYNATIHGHLDYEALGTEAARLQKSGKGPIVIMGHSLGADAAIFMAEKMKALGAPVALVVTFGPTCGEGFRFQEHHFNGAADINHLNVEKSSRLHAGVIGKIQTIVGHRRAESMARQGRCQSGCCHAVNNLFAACTI
jgi:thioesterase domain-containing protein